MQIRLLQKPAPGDHSLYFKGDTACFELEADAAVKGKAFLRTNLGNAFIRRKEIIEAVETKRQRSGQDWHDIPMEKTGEKTYSVTLALLEVGHFEAKCFFLTDESPEPVWVGGDNLHINVEPSDFCCANSIYCAFVRQFGENKIKRETLGDGVNDLIHTLDKKGYSVIPPSGTFRSLIHELDIIIDRLKCRIIHLLPVNPTPTVFARMGRFGSPYAALDFTSVDPALAEFDRKSTPLDQFLELVDAVHRRNAKVFIDMAINHTGWASKIHEDHPEWLVRESDGTIHCPGAWGVVWGDLTELNHNRLDLWKYVAAAFITWCSRGVDGFRCDAGYMIPCEAWEFIIARVRNEYPDTIFLLEGLGGDTAITRQLLDKANMNCAYSELFQNFTRQQIEGYVPFAQEISFSEGLMVHYAETHDNSRLAAVSPIYAQMRTALCALTSSNGAFGFTNGVEWFATEKIDVHEANALNWGNPENQIPHIRRLNSILICHPSFFNNSSLRFIDSGHPRALAFVRTDVKGEKSLLVFVNLDCNAVSKIVWEAEDVPFECKSLLDLISEEYFVPTSLTGRRFSLLLAPGQVLCLTANIKELAYISEAEGKKHEKPDKIVRQSAQAIAFEVLCRKNRSNVICDLKPKELALKLLDDPYEFVSSFYDPMEETPVVIWEWPTDMRRTVMIPPGHHILVKSPYRFRAKITGDGKIIVQRDSLKESSGKYFALFMPLPVTRSHASLKMKVSVYADDKSRREEAEILLLSPDDTRVHSTYSNADIRSSPLVFLDTNGRGGMLHACVQWGELKSRYDALLAANLSVNYPEDRHIMWRRCRMWIDFRGRREVFSLDTVENFTVNTDGSGTWNFHLPVGNGLLADVSVNMLMIENENAVRIEILRHLAPSEGEYLSDDLPVRIIVRPDIEDRNFHAETKAMYGAETHFPRSVEANHKSMTFAPSKGRSLVISTYKGKFVTAPEWQYSVYHEKEASRGLEAFSDLFSPGYFEITLDGGEGEQIIGQVLTPLENRKIQLNNVNHESLPADSSFEKVLFSAMDKFIVRRDGLKTVIAGYPWFLDWGRDTLICARGLIAAGKIDEVSQILLLFSKFEERGTLPNTIQGAVAGNRDTSDAPLWLFVACSDFIRKTGRKDFLETDVEGRGALVSILESIAHNYIKGTSNGIIADKDSGLIFSPSHFTWMDTNYPAGSPREGYPVEIQALWYFALSFLAENTDNKEWKLLADRVRSSFMKLFYLENEKYLADCLHAESGQPATKAETGDALRPNQLFAVTLGLVKDPVISRNILLASSSLLIPGAIRTLADRPVSHRLPVYGKNSLIINDPPNPYWARYEGDEDYRRKPAYHNGTAWTWPFPSYSEAYYLTYGNSGRKTAKSILASSKILLEKNCIHNIPEIFDGDYPHTQRGCDAQAWGVTELYRVWKML
jgi:starch synthase (maltosyl-transferring)